ncbi:MAG: hypothetical protein LBJ22_02570 [Synergistaceae bacterium]|nr:hypothetical protein [Synergistaceae bacterium]
MNLNLNKKSMTTEGIPRTKESAGGGAARRQGFALHLALVVLLVGGILVIAIFQFTSMSFKETTGENVLYGDQMLVTSCAEKAKGAILSEMQRIGKAIHPGEYTKKVDEWQQKPRPAIKSVDDLQIKFDADTLNSGLSSSVSNDWTENGRRVVLQVFDLTYDATQIQSSNILKDMTELRRLPPALNLNSKQTSQGGTGNIGDNIGATDTRKPLDDDAGKEIDLGRFGAYLIRARIFDPGANKPIRLTEEAFFQVLPSSPSSP